MSASGKDGEGRSKIEIIFDWMNAAFNPLHHLSQLKKDAPLKNPARSQEGEYVRPWCGHLDPGGIDQLRKWQKHIKEVREEHPEDPCR